MSETVECNHTWIGEGDGITCLHCASPMQGAPTCKPSLQVPEPSAAGEADFVTQLCDMLDAAGVKATFCGECSVRGPSCTAQWCDSHERMMREGRAVVEETLTEWERVTQHFASRSQTEQDHWATKVAEREPRAAALRAFLKHVDRLTIRSTMLATQSARLREMEGERDAELEVRRAVLFELEGQGTPASTFPQRGYGVIDLARKVYQDRRELMDALRTFGITRCDEDDPHTWVTESENGETGHDTLAEALQHAARINTHDQLTTLTTAHARVLAAVRAYIDAHDSPEVCTDFANVRALLDAK